MYLSYFSKVGASQWCKTVDAEDPVSQVWVFFLTNIYVYIRALSAVESCRVVLVLLFGLGFCLFTPSVFQVCFGA